MTKALAPSGVGRAGSGLLDGAPARCVGKVSAAERRARVGELFAELREVNARDQGEAGPRSANSDQEKVDVWDHIAFWGGAVAGAAESTEVAQ